jgi:hypothetical protein
VWFQIPTRDHRFAPCKECEHDACVRLRRIAASPCMLCRKAIGWGCRVLDERTDLQKDKDYLDVGFVHSTCRKRFKQRYTPPPRRPPPDHDPPPTTPTAVFLAPTRTDPDA